MFEVHYRIVDDFAVLKSIEPDVFDRQQVFITGFFELCFGEYSEGCYYHENPLRADETGGELLDYWFNYLIKVVNILPQTKYAAFKEIETFDRWLEFKLLDDKVIINVANDKGRKNNNLFVTEIYNGFSYVEPLDFLIEFAQFREKIIRAANSFVSELKNINQNLLKTKCIIEISQRIMEATFNNAK